MGRADIVYRLSVWSDFGGSGKKFHTKARVRNVETLCRIPEEKMLNQW